MDRRETNRGDSRGLEDWEIQLIKQVVYKFQTAERDELEAELLQTLLQLKRTQSERIRDWKGYLAKALYNRASNVIRGWRRREKREAQIAEWDLIQESRQSSIETDLEFKKAWSQLDPDLRHLWQVLAEEGGNQVRAARRLGKHRNTIRLAIQKLKQIVAGFEL